MMASFDYKCWAESFTFSVSCVNYEDGHLNPTGNLNNNEKKLEMNSGNISDDVLKDCDDGFVVS